MATSLAQQLAHIAASSRSSLNVKAQKAAHSKSLLWEPAEAATQSFEFVYGRCVEDGGFEELCRLDPRFAPFAATLFSDQSQREDRTQLSAAENAELDRRVDAFLMLVGGRLRLNPAVRSLEWLVRRFRIHEYSTKSLITTFLPYHALPVFLNLLAILPDKLPAEYQFLRPYAKALQAPPRAVIVHAAVQGPAFISLLSEYTIETCRAQYHYPPLVAFWAGIMTEAVNELLDRNRSGRRAIQATNDQALLHRLGPIFAKAMSMKKVPSLQVASYMVAVVFVSKSTFEAELVHSFMEQLVAGWTAETVRTGMVCLGVMAQHNPSPLLSRPVTRALLKINNLAELLVAIGREHRVDRLARALCLALVERLSRKGEAKGLSIISKLVTSTVMHEAQVTHVLKALLQAAYQLDANVDKDGSLRAELATVLNNIQQPDTPTYEAVQKALGEVGFDVEELELKLNMTMRPAPLAIEAPEEATEATPAAATSDTVKAFVEQLATHKDGLESGLAATPGPLFAELNQAFASIVALHPPSPELLAQFTNVKALGHKSAFKDYTYFAFFIRIWCGPLPALTRAAALDTVKERVKAESPDSDAQFLIPYCIVALSDRSPRVRRAAANLLVTISTRYPNNAKAKAKAQSPENASALYGETCDGMWMAPGVAGELLHNVLASSAEECIMDPGHIHALLESWIDDARAKDAVAEVRSTPLKSQVRLQILSFLSAHTVHTPLIAVKDRLLVSLNQIKSASSTPRTKFLLPLLKWWSELNAATVAQLCAEAKVGESTMDTRIVETVVPADRDGLSFLLKLAKNSKAKRQQVTTAAFKRLQATWPSMKADAKLLVASEMLELSQTPGESNRNALVASEASGLLHGVELTADILLHFLESVHTAIQAITGGQRPSKRRKTDDSSDAGSEAVQTQSGPEVSAALRRATVVLQLVEGSEPGQHSELFDALFSILGELLNLRAVVGSELGYLQNSLLRSLLAMTPAYQAKQRDSAEASGGYGDLLVGCIQGSSSPAVQNSALLLIASLASTAPDVVLHSVMPIFAFMGSSVLRQADDYSAHVVNQTIAEVVPPLIASLRKGRKTSVVAAAAELLGSFTTAFEHIPDHRRERMFESLTTTLGEREFLFAVAAMLVDRYGPDPAIKRFAADLFAKFSVEVQLESIKKMLDLVDGLFAEPKASLSTTLLRVGKTGVDKEQESVDDTDVVAARQLAALPALLANKTIRTQFARLAKRDDDHEASKLRELYSGLLEGVLLLAAKVKTERDAKGKKGPLHDGCGAILAALLKLLGIGEFVKVAEHLLGRPNLLLRQKVLRALDLRIERERVEDAEARTALLGFLPHLTKLLRESADVQYKHTAVACIDQIAEKYGRRDVEAVEAAALVIGSDYCLGQKDASLQRRSLLCLASLVDVLGDSMVSVLPSVTPLALRYLASSLGGKQPDVNLHASSYGFLSALAETLPYMMAPYLGELLSVSNLSAETELNGDSVDMRRGFLRVLAHKMEPREIVVALQKNWPKASFSGGRAISEFLDTLRLVVAAHPKSAINKNVHTLFAIVMAVLDLRRQTFARGELDEPTSQAIAQAEASVNDTMLHIIYKLNDAAFRPVFSQLMEWAGAAPLPSETDARAAVDAPVDAVAAQAQRRFSVYGFLLAFFDNLKGLVAGYATYMLDDALKTLGTANLAVPMERAVWARVLAVLTLCFEHDQDETWQQPARFSQIMPALVGQFLRAAKAPSSFSDSDDSDVSTDIIPAVVGLAVSVDSVTHFKELNTALLKLVRHDRPEVRLAVVRCQQALTDRLGTEWLDALAEMLPYIGELQDDDDETVERETQRWIVKIEGVMGESLDSMLQ